MILDLVKRGGRTEFTCAKCNKNIEKGSQHYRESIGGKQARRYHLKCKPAEATVSKKNQPVEAAAESENTETENKEE